MPVMHEASISSHSRRCRDILCPVDPAIAYRTHQRTYLTSSILPAMMKQSLSTLVSKHEIRHRARPIIGWDMCMKMENRCHPLMPSLSRSELSGPPVDESHPKAQ